MTIPLKQMNRFTAPSAGPGRKSPSRSRVHLAEAVEEPAQGGMALSGVYPQIVESYPKLRFMGSKFRLLPWMHSVLKDLEFETAIDAFSGSGCVSYLLKAMGKQVVSNDFLNMGATITKALVENSVARISSDTLEELMQFDPKHKRFIEQKFSGIFFTFEDLRFLDLVSWNLAKLSNPYEQAIARAALIRSCVKRQPRGVFTVAGDPERYKDARRDLHLTLKEHFQEQVAVYNDAVFDNGQRNLARRGEALLWTGPRADLVYMDPPYVPRADDNCYVKRYHFLEGLSCYWEGLTIMEKTRVKKIEKPFTPFSYRRKAAEAFDQMFEQFGESTLVLSYSSNGYPDLSELLEIMGRYKSSIEVHERAHRYHFGTHKAVERAQVQEYLIVGR